MKPNEIQDHIFGTYLTLRYGMAALAIGFPLLIFLVGRCYGLQLQNSLSAYYWASLGAPPPVRDWFVGSLFAFAAFFYLYKGFTHLENWALNLASLFAVGVATIPMQWPENPSDHSFSVHGACAVLLFACLWYVVLFRSRDTFKHLPSNISFLKFNRDQLMEIYKSIYIVIGILMVLSPLVAVFISTILGKPSVAVFFIEAGGVVAFGWYWLIKSHELRFSRATRRALRGELWT